MDAPSLTPLNIPPRKSPALPRLIFMAARVFSIVVQNLENWSDNPIRSSLISSILNDARLLVIVTTMIPRMKNQTTNTTANVSITAASLRVFGLLSEADSMVSNFITTGLSRYVSASPRTSGFRTSEAKDIAVPVFPAR